MAAGRTPQLEGQQHCSGCAYMLRGARGGAVFLTGSVFYRETEGMLCLEHHSSGGIKTG